MVRCSSFKRQSWLTRPGRRRCSRTNWGGASGITRTDKIYSIIDYSYRSKSCAGDGFMLIGDAYGFLDPIYSSGVLLALKMAELAADSIHDAFNNNDFSAARLGQFQAKLDK